MTRWGWQPPHTHEGGVLRFHTIGCRVDGGHLPQSACQKCCGFVAPGEEGDQIQKLLDEIETIAGPWLEAGLVVRTKDQRMAAALADWASLFGDA